MYYSHLKKITGQLVVSLGHILTLDKSTTGDAIIAALQVLTVMVEQGKALHELVAGLELFPSINQCSFTADDRPYLYLLWLQNLKKRNSS